MANDIHRDDFPELKEIVPPSVPPENATASTNFDKETQTLDLVAKATQIQAAKSDIEAKSTYSRLTFWLVCAWICGVFALLMLEGFHAWGFHLSDAVLLAAIGSTTANVIGMLLVVLKNLFPTKKDQ